MATTATTDTADTTAPPRGPGDDGWKRLANAVTARRAELMLTKQAAADLAGVSLNGFRRVEDGVPLRNTTLIGVDKAMGWEVGSSARLVTSGVEPKIADNTRKDAVDSELYESLLTAISSLNVSAQETNSSSRLPYITAQIKLSPGEAELITPELRKELSAATSEIMRLFVSFSVKARNSA
jgi:hypothetical protein